ncbi:sigma-70 family RNA polymerase sigma factor [Luteimonas sp. Y-2-2-4F]|nr:sigma-70 family RNA polymerase sigma factor [Luteimonas sp. Y-2-2-4F]MCD9030970.1 sigma-70 family RNA polymerase sigma factor [Luteimonas sp. Y-2-2-4F]
MSVPRGAPHTAHRGRFRPAAQAIGQAAAKRGRATMKRSAFSCVLPGSSQGTAMPSASTYRPAETAFEGLDLRFRPGLVAFFLRRTGSHAEAEDLTQEVFLRLAGMDTARLQSAEAYIFQIAANLLRDRGRRERVRFDYQADAAAVDGAGIDSLDPLRVTASRETLAGLTAALRELPERTREIFILYRLESASKRDIAEAFGISLSTLDRHLMRAMAHLTRRVEAEE